MLAKTWTVRAPSGTVELAVQPAGGGAQGEAARSESRHHVLWLAHSFRNGDAEAQRVVLDICAELDVLPPPGLHHVGPKVELAPARIAALSDQLLRAVESGRLVLHTRASRRVIQELEMLEVLGPEQVSEAEPDIYVLAAEVKLIGDTPLIRHAVRVLDPDTGEIVADGIETDENGIVRTEVPANKKYRIEIVDRDHDFHVLPTVSMPNPMLRCAFVDMAGSPVANVDVIVKDLEGNEIAHTTEDDGLLELPAALGLYEVIVNDESHWVHSLLATDGTADAYEVVVSHKFEDGEDGIDPDDRLTRSWTNDLDAEDDDDDGETA